MTETTQRKEADGLPELLRASGIGVVAFGCGLTAQLGSGIAVGPPGHVVTVAHTIAGATKVEVVDADGTVHDATVTAFDKDRDLAILRAPDLAAPALTLATTDAPAIGESTLVTWNRDDGVGTQTVVVTKRLAITIEDIYTEETVRRSGLELSGEISVGDSGGAVVGASGHVVGIVYANSRQRDRIGFATDADEVRTTLDTAVDRAVPNGRCS